MNGFYFLSHFIDRNQKKVYNKNKTRNKTLKIGIFALPNRKEKDIKFLDGRIIAFGNLLNLKRIKCFGICISNVNTIKQNE